MQGQLALERIPSTAMEQVTIMMRAVCVRAEGTSTITGMKRQDPDMCVPEEPFITVALIVVQQKQEAMRPHHLITGEQDVMCATPVRGTPIARQKDSTCGMVIITFYVVDVVLLIVTNGVVCTVM